MKITPTKAPTRVPINLYTPALYELAMEFFIENIAAITVKKGYSSLNSFEINTLKNTAMAVLMFLLPILSFVLLPPFKARSIPGFILRKFNSCSCLTLNKQKYAYIVFHALDKNIRIKARPTL